MATEAVRDITEGVNFTARGREAHEGSKINSIQFNLDFRFYRQTESIKEEEA